MHTEKTGGDIEVDTTASHKRVTNKQKQRINSTRKRAARAGRFGKRNAKARRIALTGVHTAQIYGHTAVGMAPTNVSACKTNMAEATGLSGAGACATTAIRWTFKHGRFTNTSADPGVTIPSNQIKSWMALWGRSDPVTKARIRKSWHEFYKKCHVQIKMAAVQRSGVRRHLHTVGFGLETHFAKPVDCFRRD